jgi:DNA-binding NarL/FixJ family response regulator
MNAVPHCRVYVLYRHPLFAQGVRNLLEGHDGVSVVGFGDDLGRASLALRDARPDVILVEESLDCSELWTFLEAAGCTRIVTVSMSHTHATVYDPHRTSASSVSDLVDAILGRADSLPVSVGRNEHR